MSRNQAVVLGNRRDPGAAVEFQHVSKRFGPGGSGSNAVVDLSLSVPPGEICVLVGPSGCGKTTSLKMVNRLVEPTSGKVLIDGRDISTVEPTELRRGIGYVIQQIGLFPHRTVAQNVATVPRLLGWPEARVRTRVDELLALVGLDSTRVRDRYPSQLSGGERQRIGVARAMAAEPPVMLMDEPFGAVDPIVREHLQDEFLRIHGLLRMTVLFVTHDIDEAIKMGSRVAVLQEGGHLAQFAPPDELLLNPTNEFVARFVGADRALKRLALSQVKDVSLEPLTTVRLGAHGEPTGSAIRGLGTVLVDGDERPVGWVTVDLAQGVSGLGPNDVEPIRALVQIDASLRDALSAVLESPEQVGVVVDQMGRLLGAITVETISSTLRPSRDAGASTLSRAGREPS